MQKYPIGIQDFGKLISQGFVYVDKTMFIHRLANQAGVYFLSRPRRFGKSLLVSTLNELFTGQKELFEGTFIYDKWDWTTTNPVIRISFANQNYRDLGLKHVITALLKGIGLKYGIQIENENYSEAFKELIIKLSEKLGQVVILIDEYDKPIIDFLGAESDQAEENRKILKGFYSVLKDADSHIRLLFITGISKFSKVSIFSDLNHLNDITLDRNYGGICGITEIELLNYFPDELKVHDINQIKEWYNGYTWDRQIKVYNPFSLLNFFSKGEYLNYWYQSGHPSLLWNLLKKSNKYDLDNYEADLIELDSYDIVHIDPKVLLYQTGYLTFGEELAQNYYNLRFPNKEVEQSFNSYLWSNYSEHKIISPTGVLLRLKEAFKTKDFEKMQDQLNILFASLPYDFMIKEKEVVFHAIIHLTFTLLGELVLSEVHTHKGRCDALVISDDAIYCFEFKLGKSAKEALDQIHEKGYLNPYKGGAKKCYAIGVNYSKETREIDDFEWEEV